MVNLKFLIILFATSCTTVSASTFPCLITDNYRDVGNLHDYIVKVVAYDGTDTRQSIADYARSHSLDPDEVNKDVSATGTIRCLGSKASANVTVSSSVVTTAHHVLCEAHARPSQCTFTYSDGKNDRTIQFSDTYESGADCASKDDGKDWAVLRLRSPAVGPRPYKIDRHYLNQMNEGTKLVIVSDHSVDFCAKNSSGQCLRDKETKGFILPRSMSDCEAKKLYYQSQELNQIITNCPMGAGASGGAILTGDLQNPVLVGINVGTNGTNAEAQQERRTAHPVIKSFEVDSWSSSHIALNREFASAVERAAEAENANNI